MFNKKISFVAKNITSFEYNYYNSKQFLPGVSASLTSRATRLILWPNRLKFLDAPIAPTAVKMKCGN